jgi:hypothetical protein
MYLLSWHGTLLCLPDASGVLQHLPLPLPDAAAAVLIARPREAGDATISHPDLGTVLILQTGRGRLNLMRDGQYLSAERDATDASFNRTGAGEWETFLPLEHGDLADLQHVLRNRWIVLPTRQVIRRATIGIKPGFKLRVGPFTAAIDDGLGAIVAHRDADGRPDRLSLGGPEQSAALGIAAPRSSALLDTPLWPTRARRIAETVAIAVHRHMTGFEPRSEVMARDAAFLEENGGVVALGDLLERVVPMIAAPGTVPGWLLTPELDGPPAHPDAADATAGILDESWSETTPAAGADPFDNVFYRENAVVRRRSWFADEHTPP